MAKTQSYDFTTPVGRLVGGSVYLPKDKEADGTPRLVKKGPNAGKPKISWDFALAIPKVPGQTHWSQHPFFAPIWNFTHAAYPQGQAQVATFAWKILDGDSTVPNKNLNKNCDLEGFPGHWVVWFSTSSAPTIWNADGTQQILEADAIKKGYFIQVQGSVAPNNDTQSPGIYWNHYRVALAAYGREISSGPTVAAAGFGQGVQLPAGASTAPVAAAFSPAPPPPVPGAPIAPPVPALAPPPPLPIPAAAPVPTLGQPTPLGLTVDLAAMRAGGQWTEALLVQHGYITAAPLPVPAPLPPAGSAPPPPGPALIAPVVPNPAILAIPGAPVPPPPAVAPPSPAPAARQMTAAAGGATYEAMIAGGWTDITLIQNGMMLA